MLYKIAHFLQFHVRPIWQVVEWGNGVLFKIRYDRKLEKSERIVLSEYPKVRRVQEADIDALESFFAKQPTEAFEFFRPHSFDKRSLERLSQNPSFLMYVYLREREIVGYFFLRSFFIGKSYLGKMVDIGNQGHGIGQQMCLCAMDLASSLGLRMYETISKENLASLYSSQKVLEVNVLEEMSNGYLYIEDIRKRSEI
ncbi:MAG: GNAT family N-acetyltransferase [Bacteroidales bacterium]|nr:GNAT family N-acetyltransferase [Bacteroidales bacterium]